MHCIFHGQIIINLFNKKVITAVLLESTIVTTDNCYHKNLITMDGETTSPVPPNKQC